MGRLAGIAVALAVAGVPIGAAVNVEAQLGQPLTLKIGDVATFARENLEVTFAALVSDSRCPRNVQCIQAGEATIRIVVEKRPERPQTLLVRSPSPADEVTYAGYRFG